MICWGGELDSEALESTSGPWLRVEVEVGEGELADSHRRVQAMRVVDVIDELEYESGLVLVGTWQHIDILAPAEIDLAKVFLTAVPVDLRGVVGAVGTIGVHLRLHVHLSAVVAPNVLVKQNWLLVVVGAKAAEVVGRQIRVEEIHVQVALGVNSARADARRCWRHRRWRRPGRRRRGRGRRRRG